VQSASRHERSLLGGTDWIVSGGLLLALVTVLMQVTLQLIDFGVYDLRIGALDSNLHTSVFGAASLAAQGAAAVAAAVRGASVEHRIGWIAAAALIAMLLALRISVSYSTSALLPFVVAVFVLLWWLTADEPEPARTIVRLGLCLLVFSFVVHATGPRIVAALGYGGNSWPYQVKGVLKHCTELGGWMIVATGIARAARSRP
jgi:hypothetical protein